MVWKYIKSVVICASLTIFIVSAFNPPQVIGLPFHFVFGYAASFFLLILVYLGIVYAPEDEEQEE